MKKEGIFKKFLRLSFLCLDTNHHAKFISKTLIESAIYFLSSREAEMRVDFEKFLIVSCLCFKKYHYRKFNLYAADKCRDTVFTSHHESRCKEFSKTFFCICSETHQHVKLYNVLKYIWKLGTWSGICERYYQSILLYLKSFIYV